MTQQPRANIMDFWSWFGRLALYLFLAICPVFITAGQEGRPIDWLVWLNASYQGALMWRGFIDKSAVKGKDTQTETISVEQTIVRSTAPEPSDPLTPEEIAEREQRLNAPRS